MLSYDTGKTMTSSNSIMDRIPAIDTSKKNKHTRTAKKESEYPALFCDEGDCTLG